VGATRSSAIDPPEDNASYFHHRGQASQSFSPGLSPPDLRGLEDEQTERTSAYDPGLSPYPSYELHSVSSKQTMRVNDYGFEVALLLDQNTSYGNPPLLPEYVRDSGNWYMPRMLVNRTLRGMTGCMVLFASLMLFTCISHIGALRSIAIMGSTSVPFNNNGDTGSCKSLEGQSLILHLVINIAATMILGISNTYQQLVTSLKTSEIRWALCKFRDVRVGTNAPSNINRKKTGKGKAWCFWTLLISTSLPIHLLANSIIGPALVYKGPELTGVFTSKEAARASLPATDATGSLIESFGTGNNSAACYEAFRTGSLSWGFDNVYSAYAFYGGTANMSRLANSKFSVVFDSPCASFSGKASYTQARTEYVTLFESNDYNIQDRSSIGGSCYPGDDVSCMIWLSQDDSSPVCRLQIRMQAALILMGCLIFKATYMVLVNFRASKVHNKICITWGDVVAASTVEPGLKIKNECLVNAGDSFRQRVAHICHKHCRTGAQEDNTGDSLGHCQKEKCKKFNIIDKAADLPQPSLATKFKRPLLAGLGLASIGQMLILTTCSMGMVGLSIYLALVMAGNSSTWRNDCRGGPNIGPAECEKGLAAYLWQTSGEFGGFQSSITVTSLEQDSLTSEILTFFISNGLQLLYSAIYLLLIYNISLIVMEHDWGKFDHAPQRLRCTIFKGDGFDQSYFLQLPHNVLVPVMIFSSTMHWLLGQALNARENIYVGHTNNRPHSQYDVTFGTTPFWMATCFMMTMTAVCWWAFTYKREGFIPQMYGSMRVLCASTTELFEFGHDGVMWGEMVGNRETRLAGFSSGPVNPVQPNKFYPGVNHED
jgi:hypothetical protein